MYVICELPLQDFKTSLAMGNNKFLLKTTSRFITKLDSMDFVHWGNLQLGVHSTPSSGI